MRKIITIDEEKCFGCGACARACQEGAIGMVNGKAVLLRDDYCDGLGNCLPVCPTGAITFEEREAAPFSKKAVEANKKQQSPCSGGGCPSSQSKTFKQQSQSTQNNVAVQSQLRQWPVQIKLAPINATFFSNANLLIAADCAAYAYADFHNKFMRNKVTLIGCPKFDGNYADKLTEIIKNNDIKSVTLVRMEVPCCGGLENAVKHALQASGKFIPWQIVTLSTDGNILE